jgi:hypothetical protein
LQVTRVPKGWPWLTGPAKQTGQLLSGLGRNVSYMIAELYPEASQHLKAAREAKATMASTWGSYLAQASMTLRSSPIPTAAVALRSEPTGLWKLVRH